MSKRHEVERVGRIAVMLDIPDFSARMTARDDDLLG